MHPIYHFCSRKVVQMSSSERVKLSILPNDSCGVFETYLTIGQYISLQWTFQIASRLLSCWVHDDLRQCLQKCDFHIVHLHTALQEMDISRVSTYLLTFLIWHSNSVWPESYLLLSYFCQNLKSIARHAVALFMLRSANSKRNSKQCLR